MYDFRKKNRAFVRTDATTPALRTRDGFCTVTHPVFIRGSHLRRGGSDTGASRPPLQEVEERAAESSRAGNRLEGGKVQARANIGAVLSGNVLSSGAGLPGSHRGREVPTLLSGAERVR